MLEVSNICLVNATALGYEILEGLVLLGIGGFTISDSKVIEEDDLGIHLFLDAAFLGHSRAATCMKHLRELYADIYIC